MVAAGVGDHHLDQVAVCHLRTTEAVEAEAVHLSWVEAADVLRHHPSLVEAAARNLEALEAAAARPSEVLEAAAAAHLSVDPEAAHHSAEAAHLLEAQEAVVPAAPASVARAAWSLRK